MANEELLASRGRVALRAQVFHYRLDELLGFGEFKGDDPDVHHGGVWIAVGVAIDAMLADEYQSVGDEVKLTPPAAVMRA